MPAGNTDGPDKRTTAYENIFGRPTAKPKGPVSSAQPSMPPHVQQWVHQQAYGAQPAGAQRWNGAPGGQFPPRVYGAQPYPQQGQTMMGGGPAYGYGQSDGIDRRASVAPSISSQDPRASMYYAPHSPAMGASTGNGGPHATESYGGANSGYQHQQPGGSNNGYAPHRPAMSSQAGGSGNHYSFYSEGNAGYQQATGGAPVNAASPDEPGQLSSPRPDPPRLPSIELGGGSSSAEDHWFTNGSNGNARHSKSSATSKTQESADGSEAPLSPTPKQSAILSHPNHDSEATEIAGGGDTNGSSETYHLNDYQEYQRQTASKSGGSSLYDGNGRRRGSFESDRQSIANSIYTLPGAVGNSSRIMYGQGGQGSYFHPHPQQQQQQLQQQQPSPHSHQGIAALTPYNASDANLTWGRQTRMRTTSSATQAAQGIYAPGYADQNTDWRKSVESTSTRPGGDNGRSLSVGQQQARTSANSPHGSVGSAMQQTTNASGRRGPLVYPALLSRVADAFKQRVTLSERQKDGLSYTDAFDGREAVDRIAYIIKTTDRNLALLLGRALDAQKFFHDVTYDHRLRDSPNELYQFRVRLTSPFGSDGEEHYEDASDQLYKTPSASGGRLSIPSSSKAPTRDNSTSSIQQRDPASPVPELSTPATSIPGGQGRHALDDDVEDALPTGVFTLLTDCYSPTCTRDRLCYSIACPRRLEQQARLNMKPQPGLKRSISKESLGDVKEQGALWADSVSEEVLKSLSDSERKRQELINEVIYTERDFVRDLEYLRDSWIKPLRSRDMVPEAKRDDFVTQVFWNVLEIHAVNSKLAELLSKRQKQQAVVERIGDILLEMVPHFQPFVKYGAHQLYGKYEFEKEKSSNLAFSKFVEETERLPESRKLELNGYLTKPTTRLARYPLLLEAVNKSTPDDNPDKQALPKVIKIVREFLSKVNAESGKSENRFNLAQLDQQLVFKQGEAVDLRLRDEQRELVFKGPLKKRGGSQSESAELQVFLFDHAVLMVKAKTVHKNDLYKVFRKPIPLELLIVTVYDDVPTGKGNATRPKSVMSKTSTGSRLSGGVPTGSAPKQDPKTGYALTFTYLGRKGYSQTLWASTFVSRKKWFEHIESRQEILRQRSNIFDTMTLSEGFFQGPSRVTCSVPFDFGRRIIYGADDGVYLSDLREKARPPTKVLPLPGVTQIDVLEEYQILIILAERSVHTFTLDALDPSDPMGSLKRGRRISSHTSFFRAGQCLGRTLVCVVKSSSLSSTIKTLEPIEQNVRGKKQPTFRKLLQGGQETLRVFKEFYIPTESSSIHFLKSKLCVGCTKGFEIVDLETLDTQGLLDPADSNLDFVQRKETVKPIAIYRIDGEFLLCYDDFAFYVNKNGWRAKGNWIIHWEGNPTSFALHYPYVLAFEPSFVEVRHVQTGALHQVITGYNLRCLFADVPPATSGSASSSSSSLSSSSSAHSSLSNLHGAAGYGARPGMPQGYPSGSPYGGPPGALSRQQSFNMMGAPIGPHGSPYGTPRPPAAMSPYGGPQQPPQQQQMMYPARPGMPYAFTQAQAPRPPPQPQRNPVWESVAASRTQIVFIGDTSVFCIRPAGSKAA